MAKKPTEEEMNRLIKEMEELAEAKEWETLKADAETVIKKFPDDAMGYFFLGSSKSELGDFSEGLDNLDQAIRKNPKNANFYNNRGSIKDNLGRLEEAIEDLDKAIALDPNSSLSFFNRGTIKYKLGRYNEAIEDLNIAINLDPNDPRFYHNRAMAIGKKAAKESEAKITAAYDAQLKDISDPQKIIELYEDEINRSSLRTYGTKSFTTQEDDKKEKADQLKKAERLEKAGKPIKKFAWHIWYGLGHCLHWFLQFLFPNSLEKKANRSSSLLRVFVIIIFAFLLVLYLANNLFDFISVLLKFSLSGFTNLQLFKGHISDITLQKALSFLSFQAILSAPFYLYARRVNREFQEERVRLHALMRDRNLILLWSAQERENKALFSGKLFDQMTQSSTADLSLRMMNPRQAARFQEASRPLIQGDDPYDKGNRDRQSQDKRDANLIEKITDAIKSAN